MMAAEVGSEELGSVSGGTEGGGGPDTGHFQMFSQLRVTEVGQGVVHHLHHQHQKQTATTSLSEVRLYPFPAAAAGLPGTAMVGSGAGGGGHATMFGTSSGVGSGEPYPSALEGQSSRTSPTSAGPVFDGSSAFPPLPPPPPPPPAVCGGLGTVDESDMPDGPEYEEEEVAFPLTAPPTNQ
ncbi:RASA1 protein, partial [Polyodon spathula]|nr:RASA1 protein [Polyodon spathula]